MKSELSRGNVSSARVSPHNLEAEMSVLGAMLLDKEVIPQVIREIDGGCFYHDAHRKIFDAAVKLYDENQPADAVTLTEALRKSGDLEAVGGPEYVISLINYVPTTAHLDSYLKIVLAKAMLRSLISTATSVVNRCYQDTADVAALLDEVEKEFFALTQRGSKGPLVLMRQLIKEAMETIETMDSQHGMLTGIGTGFKDLDSLTCGFRRADLVVLAGRPSMGKTALALNIAEHASLNEKKAVGIFSLEMAREQLVLRLLCSHARVDAQNLRRGFLSSKDMVKLVNAASRLSEAPIYIDDMPSVTNLELRARARNLKLHFDIELLIVDYLQLLQATSGRSENRQQEVSDISRSLKALARELDIPILVLSQLNREAENRPDRKPRLSDLRESGAIEQDADVVLLIMRPGAYPDLVEESPDAANMAYVHVAKQRNGPTGERKLSFIERYTRFENYAELKEV